MKLIIDIPEAVKHKVYAYGLSLSPSDKEQLIKAIINGIPLDKIRAEIEQMDFDFGDFYDHTDSIVEKVLQVIDKYRESEE